MAECGWQRNLIWYTILKSFKWKWWLVSLHNRCRWTKSESMGVSKRCISAMGTIITAKSQHHSLASHEALAQIKMLLKWYRSIMPETRPLMHPQGGILCRRPMQGSMEADLSMHCIHAKGHPDILRYFGHKQSTHNPSREDRITATLREKMEMLWARNAYLWCCGWGHWPSLRTMLPWTRTARLGNTPTSIWWSQTICYWQKGQKTCDRRQWFQQTQLVPAYEHDTASCNLFSIQWCNCQSRWQILQPRWSTHGASPLWHLP